MSCGEEQVPQSLCLRQVPKLADGLGYSPQLGDVSASSRFRLAAEQFLLYRRDLVANEGPHGHGEFGGAWRRGELHALTLGRPSSVYLIVRDTILILGDNGRRSAICQ
jgi:hypothetical protein